MGRRLMQRFIFFTLIPDFFAFTIALPTPSLQASAIAPLFDQRIEVQYKSGVQMGTSTFTPGDVGIPDRRQGGGTR